MWIIQRIMWLLSWAVVVQKMPITVPILLPDSQAVRLNPLVDYAPGFESGVYSPSTVVDDHPITNGPKNSGGGYRGSLHLREAVARSINTIAWQVLEKITPKYGLSFLDKMHFHNLSYVDNEHLALSLGGFTEGVRVVDMAKGICNAGKWQEIIVKEPALKRLNMYQMVLYIKIPITHHRYIPKMQHG